MRDVDNIHKLINLFTDIHATLNTDVDIHTHLKSTLLLSPHLPGKFKSTPHCLTFKYKVDLHTCELKVVTFSNIGGHFVDKNVIWTSLSGGSSSWATAHVDIFEGYFDRFAFEAIDDDKCFLAFDDVSVYNGYCV